MRAVLLIISFILLVIPQGGNHRLTLIITGVKPLKGDLYVSLHNRPDYFQVPDSAFMKKKIAVKKETETLFFDNVPDGRYAIAIYHDENLNEKMDLNGKGIPLEGYGFTTKSRVLGYPKFGQAAFDLSRNDTIEIKMIYH